MNEFVVSWHDLWLDVIGGDGTFNVYYAGDKVWSLHYLDAFAYLLYVVLVVWLSTLSIRILRSMLCGAFK